MDPLGELDGQRDVRRRRLHPDEVGVRRVRLGAGDDGVQARAHPVVALGGPLPGEERLVARVDVRGQQVGAEGVGPGDDDRRHPGHVGREPRGGQRPDVLRRRHQHLAAQVSALLLGRQLVLPVHAGRARRDHRVHELVGVQRAAEPGLGVGDDRREPLAGTATGLGELDLVGAQQRVVDPTDHGRHGVGRVQRLVRVRLAGQVGVRGDLPAGQVDGLEPRPDLLHRLVAGQRPQRRHQGARVQQLPETLGSPPGERALLADRPPQRHDVLGGVGAADAGPACVEVPARRELGRGLRLVAVPVRAHGVLRHWGVLLGPSA